jgi:outer membrane protein OmpA-like peptidoglycan-associated protein
MTILQNYRITMCFNPKFWLVTFFILFTFSVNGQKLYHADGGPDPKTRKIYGQGRIAFEKKEFDDAEKYWKKALSSDSLFVQCYLDLAALYSKRRQWFLGGVAYQQAFALQGNLPGYFRYSWGLCLWETDEYVKCRDAIEPILKDEKSSQALKHKAAKMYRDANFHIHYKKQCGEEASPLPSAINTELPEYFPILAPDKQWLFFTRRESRQEDFYVASKLANEDQDSWSTPTFYEALNSVQNDGAITFSADGNTAILVRCGQSSPHGGCDLFESFRDAKGWSEPKNMGNMINTEHWESQPAISADGRLLFFTSNRPGGFGGKDIWFSRKNKKDQWEKPKNAGPAINTPYDDISPFVHPDGKHLFFASEGHPGNGGLDIFMSFLDNNEWSTPINLGSSINSKVDESCFTLAYDGNSGLFSRVKTDPESGRMLSDIFETRLCPEIKIEPMKWVHIFTYSAADSSALNPRIEAISINTGESKGLYQSNKTNHIVVSIPEETPVALHFYAPDYAFHTEHISQKENQKGDTILIYLQPLPPSKTTSSPPVILHNLFFDIGSSSLSESSRAEIDKLAAWLQINSTLRIRIIGHTDNVGKAENNKKLSQERAAAVVAALIERGIAADRLESEGAGEEKPIDSNDTDTGRANNRRTEFQIIP